MIYVKYGYTLPLCARARIYIHAYNMYTYIYARAPPYYETELSLLSLSAVRGFRYNGELNLLVWIFLSFFLSGN